MFDYCYCCCYFLIILIITICMVLQVCLIILNFLLFIGALYDVLFSRRLGGDPTMSTRDPSGDSATTYNNPGYRDKTSSHPRKSDKIDKYKIFLLYLCSVGCLSCNMPQSIHIIFIKRFIYIHKNENQIYRPNICLYIYIICVWCVCILYTHMY